MLPGLSTGGGSVSNSDSSTTSSATGAINFGFNIAGNSGGLTFGKKSPSMVMIGAGLAALAAIVWVVRRKRKTG